MYGVPDWFLRELKLIDADLFPKLCNTSRGKRWVIYRKTSHKTLRTAGEFGGEKYYFAERLCEQVTCPM